MHEAPQDSPPPTPLARVACSRQAELAPKPWPPHGHSCTQVVQQHAERSRLRACGVEIVGYHLAHTLQLCGIAAEARGRQGPAEGGGAGRG